MDEARRAVAAMHVDDLKTILGRMAPGMQLTVPDEWLDRRIDGTRAGRAALIADIARQYCCILRPNMASHTFEKQEVPYTG